MQSDSNDVVVGEDQEDSATTPSQGAQARERSPVAGLATGTPELDGRTDETADVRMEDVTTIHECGGGTNGVELSDIVDGGDRLSPTMTDSRNTSDVDVEEANGSLRTSVQAEEVVASEEDRAGVEQDPTMDNVNNTGDEETQETQPSTAEKRRIIRREVLAEIFPARKDGESLHFDNEASTYYVVSKSVLPEIGANETRLVNVPLQDDMPADLKTTKPSTEEGQTEPSNSLAPNDSDDDERAGPMCNICLEPILESKVSGMCPHVYHCDCLLEWTKRENHDFCPTCRRPLWDSKVYNTLEIDVLDRLGFDPNFDQQQVVEEIVYEEPGVMWKYLWRFAHACCCLLILLFFLQALMPNPPLASIYWLDIDD